METNSKITRRDFLKGGLVSLAGLTGLSGLLRAFDAPPQTGVGIPPASINGQYGGDHTSHDGMGAVGEVDHAHNRFHPNEILSDFDYGAVSTTASGQTLREYEFIAVDREIEIAPGVFFPAWAYASPTSQASQKFGQVVGTVPGPSIRCIEGDRVRIHFVNAGSHPHTIHFHGIHSARMDGVPGVGAGMIAPGDSTVYEFDAFPFGCHLYHCHAIPLKRHIHKGLYGAFIIDPDPEKYSGDERRVAMTRNHNYPENADVNEMVMVMNGFDTNFDGDNEVYAANSIAFAYMNHPIKIRGDQLQRIYLINIVEFDPINSLHIHANFFDYYDHGTTLTPTLKTVDTIIQGQAQRGIVEVSFRDFEPGLYMFHAHQSELAELGWMGFFELEA
ncbi:MAG TPA: multicopper oxidase domain-containing protein [Anaerolineales bacterium]|nr:multicopper oxidase domain-containing protein [Anaerolineales bacterium]